MKKILATIFLFSVMGTQVFATRALKVVDDFDHAKGKLGTYRALVIGIQNYNDPKIPDLETPLNDARAMADILQNKYRFKVDTLLDQQATKKAIYDYLRKITNSVKPEDSILIYYAGHGDIDRTFNAGWWIPVDAKGGDPFTYLDNAQIQMAITSMKAKHVLLISDSCYSGTLFGQARAMTSVIDDKYYLNLYNEKSRWGITSGNKTPVADTGSEGHSVFAYQLINKLKKNTKPYISIQEIYTDIAPIIANNSEQQPLCRPIKGAGDMGGSFVFVSALQKKPTQSKLDNTDSDPLEAERRKIEQERKEFAKQKAEFEQERLELEYKKSLTLVSINPADKKAGIIARDGHYVKYENGIVYDENTGLEWMVGPDKDTNWENARSWVSNLSQDGRKWRMPTKNELEKLYKDGTGSRNMTSLLNTIGWWVWSGQRQKKLFFVKELPPFAWPFNFEYGYNGWYHISNSKNGRAFAVRSRR